MMNTIIMTIFTKIMAIFMSAMKTAIVTMAKTNKYDEHDNYDNFTNILAIFTSTMITTIKTMAKTNNHDEHDDHENIYENFGNFYFNNKNDDYDDGKDQQP